MLYLTLGISLYFFPGLLTLTGAGEPTSGEQGLLRILAFVMAIIGWFYVMGARTRASSFSLATVVNRVLVVPPFLLPLAFSGAVDPHLVIPFAILDPVLGLGALVVWLRASPSTPSTPSRP